jgi:hypothetical protein
MRRPLHRLTASVAAAAFSFGLLAATPSIATAGNLVDKTTFLGLEGEGEQVAALSDAIRWDLNQRGLDDGNTMTLAELQLTLGCGDDDLACFAQGGQTLGSSSLVFGEVRKVSNNYVITLNSLDVATGKLSNTVEKTVPFTDLGEAQLGATAAGLVDALYKLTTATEEPEPEDQPPGGEGPDTGDGTDEPDDKGEPGDGKLVWGPYSPRPAWKLAGVGVSSVLLLGGLGMAIGATVAIGENGPLRKDLLAEAEASLTDDKASNDIDPNSNGDLCEMARTPPDPSKPNEVTNARVTEVCIKFDNTSTVATAGWIATGVFAATTVLFTTLLFVHKNKSKTAATLREHKVGFGGAPSPRGGFMLGGSFRF